MTWIWIVSVTDGLESSLALNMMIFSLGHLNIDVGFE